MLKKSSGESTLLSFHGHRPSAQVSCPAVVSEHLENGAGSHQAFGSIVDQRLQIIDIQIGKSGRGLRFGVA